MTVSASIVEQGLGQLVAIGGKQDVSGPEIVGRICKVLGYPRCSDLESLAFHAGAVCAHLICSIQGIA
jgi:hypothetical protein